MKMLCEYFRMYHYISLGKAGKIHRYHWKSGGKTVEKHTGAFSDGMWLCKIEAQGRIGPLRRRMQGRASLVRVCERFFRRGLLSIRSGAWIRAPTRRCVGGGLAALRLLLPNPDCLVGTPPHPSSGFRETPDATFPPLGGKALSDPRLLLPNACCLLPNLPVSYCLLPVAYCLISPSPIAYCLLPAAYKP